MKSYLSRCTVPIVVLAMLVAASSAFAAKNGKPLKVVILAGQSNMQKPADWQTLKGLADSPETKPLYDKLVDENGKVRVHKDVYETLFETKRLSRWKSVPLPPRGAPLPGKFGGKVLGADEEGGSFGPELGFGVTLYEELQEPILIIKTAWGGKSLHSDFRPPNTTEWEPPKGHPEHPDSAASKLPIPTSFEMPKDFQPPEGRGKNMQVMGGRPIGEVNGIYPIYVMYGYGERHNMTDIPFETGDVILGLNGEGLGEDPVGQWRNMWFNTVREGDWMLKVTYWSPSTPLGTGAGKIKTVTLDTGKGLAADGRAAIPAYLAEKKAARKKLLDEGGKYYAMMIERIKTVLADPGKFHPAYDPKQGYEIAGFVWFHGYNDLIAGTVYPKRHLPRGYEQYSWLLAHLIRDVRKELDVPKMPVVVGVFGQGGKLDKPHPLREAQAAVADFEEFKGNVVAVRTAPFFDARIPDLQNKRDHVMAYEGNDPNHPYAKLKAKIQAYKEKMGSGEDLAKKDQRKLQGQIEKGITDIVLTAEEQAYLRNNVSNQGYHYYGSPKFFVRAGEAFAEALGGMIKD